MSEKNGYNALETAVVTDEGKAMLVWRGEPPFVVEQSETEDFAAAKPIYEGNAKNLYVTGLREGTHFFRVRGATGVTDPPLAVKAHYKPGWLVWTLMLSGLVILAATAVAILAGHRASAAREREGGEP